MLTLVFPFLLVLTQCDHLKPQDFLSYRIVYLHVFFSIYCPPDILFLFLFFFVSGSQEGGSLKSPTVSRGSQRYVIDGLSEKSSVVAEPWERLLDILAVAGARCEWQGDKGQR